LVLILTVHVSVTVFFKSLATTLRLEVEVVINTPSGPKLGSRVYNLKYQHNLDLVPAGLGGGITKEMEGEALSIEVLPGEFLFVLIGLSNHPGAWVHHAFSGPEFRADFSDYRKHGWIRAVTRSRGPDSGRRDWIKAVGRSRGWYTLPKENYPKFYAFRDLSIPRSLHEIGPEDIPLIFGPDFSVDLFRIRTTKRPVTFGQIEKILPWLTRSFSGIPRSPINDPDFIRRNN
jgi:hypothetical protein